MTLRRVDQAMAAGASRILEGVRVGPELRTRFRQLPVMVRTSGFAATYAYLVAKSDPDSELGIAYGQAATGIREHLDTRNLLRIPAGAEPPAERNQLLVAALGSLSVTAYVRASAEVELLAGWLSRLADAKYRSDRAAARGAQP